MHWECIIEVLWWRSEHIHAKNLMQKKHFLELYKAVQKKGKTGQAERNKWWLGCREKPAHWTNIHITTWVKLTLQWQKINSTPHTHIYRHTETCSNLHQTHSLKQKRSSRLRETGWVREEKAGLPSCSSMEVSPSLTCFLNTSNLQTLLLGVCTGSVLTQRPTLDNAAPWM